MTNKDQFDIIKKLLWLNITINWWILTSIIIVFCMVTINNTVVQYILFLIISTASWLVYKYYNNKIGELLK